MKRLIFIFSFLPIIAFGQFDGQDTLHAVNIKSTGSLTTEIILPQELYHAVGGFQDSNVIITITQNVWSQITNATGNLFVGLDADGLTLSGDTMIVENAGHYVANIFMNFEGTANQEYDFRVWDVDDGAMEGFILGDTGRGNNNYSKFAGAIYIIAETDNDRFVLQITNIDGSNSATLRNSNFFMYFVHLNE